jgi:hypothetical protein
MTNQGIAELCRMGHSSVRVTADVYAHAIHGQDDEAVAKWQEFQQKDRPADHTGPVQ